MENLNPEKLQEMPYSGLKKLAKRNGIKANMKRDSIVAALLCKYDEEENFEALEQSIINSSRKNKENKFDNDSKDVCETPRRETYSVETPVNVTLPESVDIMASPLLNEAVADASFGHVTVTRGSERKSKQQKVSFITPAKSPKVTRTSTPYVSLKDRPKTPVASKVSISKRISFVTPSRSNKKDSLSQQPKKSRPSTPYPLGSRKRSIASQEIKKSRSSTPCNVTEKKNSLEARKSSLINKSGHAASTDKPLSLKKCSATNSTSALKSQIKRTVTPNFKKIHQKAFDKMESIDDYQKRKVLFSAKKDKAQSVPKIPVLKRNKPIATFSGIPFVPSVTKIQGIKLNFSLQPKATETVPKTSEISSNKNKDSGIKKKAIKEIKSGYETRSTLRDNERSMRKLKFDLKASLSRKLPYKPHVGPLKPLTENNLNNDGLSTSCYNSKNETKNPVSEIRIKSREVLQGVRKNRRFELQMQNRKI